jgi:hypothetical protein
MRKYVTGLLLAVLLAGNVSAQINLRDLVGRWEMYEVYHGGREVTHQYIPDADRWIKFNTDYTFISDGEPYGHKEGTFKLDERTGLLSFDLDMGFGQKSFWYVEFDGRNMIWTDRRNPTIDQIKIILLPDY